MSANTLPEESALEKKIFDLIYSGEIADLERLDQDGKVVLPSSPAPEPEDDDVDKPSPGGNPTYKVISARRLCAHILEMNGCERHSDQRPALRWVIRGAEFTEMVDLRDGRRADGGALPAIEFSRCLFHKGFNANRAQIDSLKFTRCVFTSANSRYDINVESAKDNDAAEHASEAKPEVEVLETPGAELETTPSVVSKPNPSSAGAAANQPGDSKKDFLKPVAGRTRKHIDNFISLRNARINTELRLEWVCSGEDTTPQALVVDAFAISIGTNIVIKFTTLRAPLSEGSATDPEPRYALDLSTATIDRDLQLMPEVRLEGGLKLRDARVGGSVWASALFASDGETQATRDAMKVRHESPRAAVRMETSEISGNVIFSMASEELERAADQEQSANQPTKTLEEFLAPFLFRADGLVSLMNARIGGTLDVTCARLSSNLRCDNLHLRGDFMAPGIDVDHLRAIFGSETREIRLAVTDNISADNCQIGSNLNISANSTEFSLRSASIRGSATLKGGSLRLFCNGIEVLNDLLIEFDNAALIELEGSNINGKLSLGARFWRVRMPNQQVNIGLGDCTIGHELYLILPSLELAGVTRRPLTCLPSFSLFEALVKMTFDAGPSFFGVVGFLARDDEDENATVAVDSVVLNGDLATLEDTLRAAWQIIYPPSESTASHQDVPAEPWLDTEQKALEYLRLCNAFTWSDTGPSGFFELPDDSEESQDPAAAKPQLKSITTPDGRRLWKIHVNTVSGDVIFSSTYEIDSADGATRLLHQRFVRLMTDVEKKSFQSEISSPYRTPQYITTPFHADFAGWQASPYDVTALPLFLKRVPDWKQTLAVRVNLDGTSCRILSDRNAKTWGSASVGLETFDYQSVLIQEVADPNERAEETKAELHARLAWIRQGLEKPESFPTAAGKYFLTLALLLACMAVLVMLLIEWPDVATWLLLAFGAYLLYSLWKKKGPIYRGLQFLHSRWAARDIADQGGRSNEFRAQPYAHLASVFRRRGDDDAAREVEEEKLWQAAKSKANASLSGWFAYIFWWRPYNVMFRYGLGPWRAFITILVFWLLGWMGISMLSQNHMLEATVVKTGPAMPDTETKGTKAGQLAEKVVQVDYPCGKAVEEPLYALELLTPIINLHQESRCEIRNQPSPRSGWLDTFDTRFFPKHRLLTSAPFWEYAKAAYMVIGSVISSLAFLTFSGIARRWEH